MHALKNYQEWLEHDGKTIKLASVAHKIKVRTWTAIYPYEHEVIDVQGETTMSAKKTKVEVWGGFHNADVIRLQIDADCIPQWKETAAWLYEPGILSDGQRKRLDRHMCGIRDCRCGLEHGSRWSA